MSLHQVLWHTDLKIYTFYGIIILYHLHLTRPCYSLWQGHNMYFNDCFRKTNNGITKTEWVSECWLLTILYLETNQIFLCKVQATWRTKQKQTCSLIQSQMFLWCQFVITAKFISDIEWMIIWRLKTVCFQWHCRKERELKNQQVQQADQTKEKACYDFARLFIFGRLKFLVTPCL